MNADTRQRRRPARTRLRAQIAYAACGSGWYHDAAIQETEPAPQALSIQRR